MIDVHLKIAFAKDGCPVCRLLDEQEDRYLFGLVYENVNDGITRNLIIDSMGLCSYHAWALQAKEYMEWNDGLGTGIIYRDLLERVIENFKSFLSKPVGKNSKGKGKRLVSKAVERWKGQLLRKISPKRECHICESLRESEEAYIGWLVKGIEKEEFKDKYMESDGLCLPHLRMALRVAGSRETLEVLVGKALSKLEGLDSLLGEYIRKHAWEFRDEKKFKEEQASWIRGVAFFAGESKVRGNDSVFRLRKKAMRDVRGDIREGK